MASSPQALIELIDKMERLLQFAEKVESPPSVQRIWDAFQKELGGLIDVTLCTLFLVNENNRDFELAAVTPATERESCLQEMDYQIECGMFAWVIQRRQPALVPALKLGKERSLLILPLATLRRTLGAIMVATPVAASAVTHAHMKLLSLLTRQCSLLMENTLLLERLQKKHESLEIASREIRQLSITDPLTGSFNRGYMTERLPQEILRARRYQHCLAVIMGDVDHFKQVNDRFGHLVGDSLLKSFVQTIQGRIRLDVDWLVRYGGEEFLLVLPETCLAEAHVLAERLRSSVSAKPFDAMGQQVNITASFGITGYDPLCEIPDLSPEMLIASVDQYLYQAKREGRNRVVAGPIGDGG